MQTKVGIMSNISIAIRFGARVRILRQLKGYSQEELAYKASLHRTYIGMIERGEKNITLANIEKIAIALETSIPLIFENI
ncbi:hypothetical protein GCM10027346_43310 [Hymenobacter seoulensis]